MRVKLSIHKSYADLEIEAESFDELVNGLGEYYKWAKVIEEMTAAGFRAEEKDALKGVVEQGKDGPLVVAPKEKLTNKEAIGLILYAKEPDGVRPQDIGRLLGLSGFLSLGYGSRLSELRREGQVYKEGDQYRLTAQGRRWVEGIISALQSGE